MGTVTRGLVNLPFAISENGTQVQTGSLELSLAMISGTTNEKRRLELSFYESLCLSLSKF